MITYGLLFFSWFLFLFMAYLDNRGERAKPESIRKIIDSALFSSYHRRIATYFLSALGIPFDLILHTYLDFWSTPLISTGWYFISFLVIAIISVLFAGIRDKEPSNSEITD